MKTVSKLGCAKARQSESNRRRRPAKMLAAALGVILLTGCGGTKIKQTFDLSSVSGPAGAKAQRHDVQLTVNNPAALKALDSQNIVIRGGDGSIAFLRNAQWSDDLTDMVQARLIQALDDSGYFGGVGGPRDGMNATYQLITNLRVFGVDLDAQGKFANVEIAAKIMDTKTGEIRRTHIFAARQRLAGDSNADYAVALDSAFGAVLRNIVRWTAQGL